MTAQDQTTTLTLDDFARLYEERGAFEFIDGEITPIMPPVTLHVLTVRALFLLLYAHCVKHHAGEVFTEAPFVLMYDAEWVRGSRVPDVMFIAAARWQAYISDTPGWQSKPFLVVPDIVAEVVSPNDLYSEIQAKVERYRGDGVRLVWVIDPQRRRVSVYDGGQFHNLTPDDTLTGGDVLPDLAIPVSAIFADIPTDT